MARPGYEGPPGRELLGFGGRQDHCVEEDIFKQGMGDERVCVQNLDVSRFLIVFEGETKLTKSMNK